MRSLKALFAAALLLAGPGTAAARDAAEGGGSPEAATFERILAHPDSVEPFAYAQLVSWLWSDGRREQAAFWFYMLQARTRPWAVADSRGDGAAALRASLNQQLGSVINVWVASDPAAWKRIVWRALSFEARLPLNPARPDGMDQAAWLALVGKERAEYDADARATFNALDPADVAEQRHKAGLFNGPLDSPGPALPESWR